LARELVGGQVQHVTPNYTPFIDVDSPTGEPRRLEKVANAALYNSEGAQVWTVPALIQFIAKRSETRTALLDNTTVGEGNFHAVLEPPQPWFTDLPEGGKAQIRRIGVGIETVTEKVSLKAVSALSEGKVLTLASATLAAGTLEVLVHESPDGNASIESKLLPKKA
jgi:hypothetical protein